MASRGASAFVFFRAMSRESLCCWPRGRARKPCASTTPRPLPLLPRTGGAPIGATQRCRGLPPRGDRSRARPQPARPGEAGLRAALLHGSLPSAFQSTSVGRHPRVRSSRGSTTPRRWVTATTRSPTTSPIGAPDFGYSRSVVVHLNFRGAKSPPWCPRTTSPSAPSLARRATPSHSRTASAATSSDGATCPTSPPLTGTAT